jgi:hypothetical protein
VVVFRFFHLSTTFWLLPSRSAKLLSSLYDFILLDKLPQLVWLLRDDLDWRSAAIRLVICCRGGHDDCRAATQMQALS